MRLLTKAVTGLALLSLTAGAALAQTTPATTAPATIAPGATSPAPATKARRAVTPVVAKTPPADLSCPGDKVVWVNAKSHKYFSQGQRYFGATKAGKFICSKDADKEGDKAARGA